jgi:hypothetical protein
LIASRRSACPVVHASELACGLVLQLANSAPTPRAGGVFGSSGRANTPSWVYRRRAHGPTLEDHQLCLTLSLTHSLQLHHPQVVWRTDPRFFFAYSPEELRTYAPWAGNVFCRCSVRNVLVLQEGCWVACVSSTSRFTHRGTRESSSYGLSCAPLLPTQKHEFSVAL